jgi:hypothetical protein
MQSFLLNHRVEQITLERNRITLISLLPLIKRKISLKSLTLCGTYYHFKSSLITAHMNKAMGQLKSKWSTLFSVLHNWHSLLPFHFFLPRLSAVWIPFQCTSHMKFLIFRGNLECHSSSTFMSLTPGNDQCLYKDEVVNWPWGANIQLPESSSLISPLMLPRGGGGGGGGW